MSEQVIIDGKVFVGERIPVINANSQWSEFLLEDGTVLRLQAVLTKVCVIPELSRQMGRPMHHWEVGFLSDISIPVKAEAHTGGPHAATAGSD